MTPDGADHGAVVQAWLARTAASLTPEQQVALLERALGALWQRAQRTLGEVTLMAIFDRVVVTASEAHPILSALEIDETGVRVDGSRRRGSAGESGDLPEAMRLVLVEFLTLLGNLTDEILTPALHAELARVSLPGGRRGAEGAVAEGGAS